MILIETAIKLLMYIIMLMVDAVYAVDDFLWMIAQKTAGKMRYLAVHWFRRTNDIGYSQGLQSICKKIITFLILFGYPPLYAVFHMVLTSAMTAKTKTLLYKLILLILLVFFIEEFKNPTITEFLGNFIMSLFHSEYLRCLLLILFGYAPYRVACSCLYYMFSIRTEGFINKNPDELAISEEQNAEMLEIYSDKGE